MASPHRNVQAYTAKSSDTVLGANDPEQLKELNRIAAKRIESHSVFLFLKYFSRPALLCDSQKAKTLYLRFESLYRR